MVLLEPESLQESGKILVPPDEFLTILRRDFEVMVCPIPFLDVVETARREKWTRDPFDRIIVGQAKAAGAKLVTKGRSIRKEFPGAVW